MRQSLLFAFFLLLQQMLSAQTTLNATIQSGGLTREYRLYVPASYTGTSPVPLLFNLHGYSSNNIEQDFYGNFRPIADTANFIIAMPNGTFDNLGKRYWNNFVLSTGVDDVGFISHLIDTLRAKYNIDPDRIYSTGMSNGGFMSYELADKLANRIAAVASVTGDMVTPKLNALNPGRPVPVMEIHGTADAVVPYNGLPSSFFAPIETLISTWVNYNQCNPNPVVVNLPDLNVADGCTVTHYAYGGGNAGSKVELYKVNGGGHSWPGTAFTIDVTNQDMNASLVIWRFFRQFRLSQFTTGVAEASGPQNVWDIFPNPADDLVQLKANGAELRALRVRITDAQGKLITQFVPNGEETVDVSVKNWLSGLYTVITETERGVICQKLIVR